MGLDSVEIVLSWEDTFGITLSDSEVVELRTPQQTIDLIAAKLHASDAGGFCPTMRAFNVFRAGVRDMTGCGSQKIQLSDPMGKFYMGRNKKDFWEEFGHTTGIVGVRQPQFFFRRATVRDSVELLVTRHLKQLMRPSENWTRSLVRFGVRYGIIDIVGTRDFSDNDRFIEDIGID